VGTAQVPWWLLIVLLAMSALAVAAFIVLPLYRWFRGYRAKQVLGEVRHRLQMPLPDFLLTRRRVLADRVANDPKVLEVIDELSAEPGASRQANMRRAYKIAYDVVPSFNPAFYFRLGYWMARSFLRSLYKVRLGYQDHAALGRLGDDISLIFMLNHRTNIDYILSTYLTAQRSIMSYGVGEWARTFPIQPLMRAAGGYFLRRESDDPLYRRTRSFVLSQDNPYYFRGQAGDGVGGPHVGLEMIWPLGITMRALTSTDDAEIAQCLRMLKETHGGTGFMHESFHQDNPTRFTREWFAWANTLFGELILKVYRERPQLLRVAPAFPRDPFLT